MDKISKQDKKITIVSTNCPDFTIKASPENLYVLKNGILKTSNYCLSDSDNYIDLYMNTFVDLKKSKSKKQKNIEKSAIYYDHSLYNGYLNTLLFPSKSNQINGYYHDGDTHNDVSIKDTTKHYTMEIYEHGNAQRKFAKNILRTGLEINDSNFQKLDSFYLKSRACHGAYFDDNTNIFTEIQKKLKNCDNKEPKCFVRLVKKDYISQTCMILNKERGTRRFTDLPKSNKENKPVIYEELYADKDKYFDYYYVTKDAIYKVPHVLVHNRVDLIDTGGFDQVFQKYQHQNIDLNKDTQDEYDNKNKSSTIDELAKRCKEEIEFSECDDLKKDLEEYVKKKKQQEYKKRCENNLISLRPKQWRDFY
ncbi:MAG: hypothetical protein IJT14_01215 [Rickettsiales bacterium]|nr:hypothetical protein [Rickettsiales bacterium]